VNAAIESTDDEYCLKMKFALLYRMADDLQISLQ
jgi:hypothetical protein